MIKLYDIIIKEFPEDETIKNFANLFNGDPIKAGISEESFRESFTANVGYDPTTIYDFKRIDDEIDMLKFEGRIGDDIDVSELRKTCKNKFIEGKPEFISDIVSDELETEIEDVVDEDDDLDEKDPDEELDDLMTEISSNDWDDDSDSDDEFVDYDD